VQKQKAKPPLDRKSEIVQRVRDQKIGFLHMQFTDLVGGLKTVIINASRISDVLESGLWFDSSSVEGFGRIAESDALLRPDIDTFSVIPWTSGEHKAARLICNAYTINGEPLVADPRNILKQVCEEALTQGYTFRVGAEFEFYLLERSKLPLLEPHDHKGYFDFTPQSRATTVCENVMLSLAAFGITPETHHHEVGRGQHEITTHYAEALRGADDLLTLKLALKAFTSGTALKATWMPKPLTGFAGSGMHVHQSLWKGNTNMFYDAHTGLSSVALNFLAGQLRHARALSAIVSPSINSYKRLVTGFEAPVYICWGQTNRSALIRLPHSSPDKVEQAMRFEYRAPDPSANPYLAFAALLAAGLDGIRNSLKAPDAVEEDVYHMTEQGLNEKNIGALPTDLNEALNALEADSVISSIFGSSIDRYLSIKRQEWRDYSQQVTPWEVARYI
jgi:glutamine synthetase